MAVKNKTADSDLLADTPLPMIGVSRALAGTEVARLRKVAAALEREAVNGGVGPSGQPVPYLVQRNQEVRAELQKVKAEILELESMDDLTVRRWAYERGAR